MMNELKKVEEIKSYLRGMKSAKTLKTKRQCLENIKRINNDLKDGVIDLDYFIAKYENAKRFYSKDIVEILKNVESAIDVLKEEVKKENENEKSIIVHVTKDNIVKDLQVKAQTHYKQYVLDDEEIGNIPISYNEFYNNNYDLIEYYIIRIHDILTNQVRIDIQQMKKNLIEKDDKEKIKFSVEVNSYEPNDIEFIIYDTKLCNWFWITARIKSDVLNFITLDETKENQIKNGVITFDSIQYFDID